MFVGHSLGQQFLLNNRDRWKEEILKATKATAYIAKIICNAIRYDADDILTPATSELFLHAVNVVNVSEKNLTKWIWHPYYWIFKP